MKHSVPFVDVINEFQHNKITTSDIIIWAESLLEDKFTVSDHDDIPSILFRH